MAVESMEKIVALAKNRGFVYPGSEIYGGLANTWDYGPLGVELKNNMKKAWWKKFIQENPMNVGMDSAILMNPQTWVASGHLAGFSDPLMDCKVCRSRHRADKLIEDYINEKVYELKPNTLLFLSPVDFEKIEVEGSLSVVNLAFSGAIISSKINSLLPYGCAIYNYPSEIFTLLLKDYKINDEWFYHKYTRLVNCILIDVVRKFSKTTEIIESSPIIKALHGRKAMVHFR